MGCLSAVCGAVTTTARLVLFEQVKTIIYSQYRFTTRQPLVLISGIAIP
jgi:hypothetical protein